MKREGPQGGVWGQDVTASFLHLSGNLRGMGVLWSAYKKKCVQRSVTGSAGGSCWHSREPLALDQREPPVPAQRRLLGQHCRVLGKGSRQGLCSCWQGRQGSGHSLFLQQTRAGGHPSALSDLAPDLTLLAVKRL